MGFRGCKNVKIISHGDWSDPELSYIDDDSTTYYANYWEVEDAIYNCYKEDSNNKDYKKKYKFDDSDEDFDKYVKNHEDEVIGLVMDFASEIVKKNKQAKKDHSEYIPLDYQFSKKEIKEIIDFANDYPDEIKKIINECI